jgi:hypothetical protein
MELSGDENRGMIPPEKKRLISRYHEAKKGYWDTGYYFPWARVPRLYEGDVGGVVAAERACVSCSSDRCHWA